VAAIVVEPIQGEGGYFEAPPAFLRGLREICDEYGIVLIADEIQSGLGRTGRWWAMEHAGVEPDVITVAKGLASGMPLGAFIGRDSLFTWPAGAHGSTFAGNPVCCAAALATLDIIEDGLIDNAARMGARLKAGIEQISSDCPAVRDIRGRGLMLGVEFGSHDEANAVEMAAFERGLLILECGEAAIRFCPPLMVDEAAVDTAIRLFAESLAAVGCPVRPVPGMDETGG
jgi:4-aminobutyrate aminotransferase